MLLELIIDPTCSIVLERQPAEGNVMERKPRNPHEKILSVGILLKSILQGLAIFAASFGVYYTTLIRSQGSAPLARTMGLSVIMIANIFLVHVNSSNYDSIFKSIKNLITDKVMWCVVTGTLAGLLLMLYTPLSRILNLVPLSFEQFITVIIVAAASVLWYEVIKILNKHNQK
jgi:Ca2+-transporting ATPase